MIRSMTGFARREQTAAFGTLAWELKSVNHRYLEVAVRTPEELRFLEGEFRQRIGAAVRRGKLDAVLQLRQAQGTAAGLELDVAVLDELIARAGDAVSRARHVLGDLAAVTPIDLLRWPGVLKESERDTGSLAQAARATLDEALSALGESRGSEGARIAAMLESRCQQLAELVASLQRRVPQLEAGLRARLNDRLASLSVEPNRERLEQEIVLLLTRMDVSEELERLISHIVEVRSALASGEPAGRRLDFLMQEFNREANTLSSKSQDGETTRAAVAMKVLIEQMREQVQNVE
jgi:uncharacterized protein (TIGR00255 family)